VVNDAMNALGLSDKTMAVLSSASQALELLPGHLKRVGAKDTVFPDGWYIEDSSYTEYMPQPNSNGVEVFVAMMNKDAPEANIHRQTGSAFQEILSMAPFYTEDGVNATFAQLVNSIKTFTGTPPFESDAMQCGAVPSAPNLCVLYEGFEQRLANQWVSIADGLNGKAINTLAGSS
jgi:hypothetical protein